MLLSTLKSHSVSLSSTSNRSACKCVENSGCHFTSPHTVPHPSCPNDLLSIYLLHDPLIFLLFPSFFSFTVNWSASVSGHPWRRLKHTHKNTHLSVCVTFFSCDLSIATDPGPVWPVNSTKWELIPIIRISHGVRHVLNSPLFQHTGIQYSQYYYTISQFFCLLIFPTFFTRLEPHLMTLWWRFSHIEWPKTNQAVIFPNVWPLWMLAQR